jgi:hypothetical protein
MRKGIGVAGGEEGVFSTKKRNVSFCWVGFERMHPLRYTLPDCHLAAFPVIYMFSALLKK